MLLGSEARLMLWRVPLILLIPLDRGYPDPVDTPAPDFGLRGRRMNKSEELT